MKRLLFLFLLLPSLLFSQVSPSKIERIANTTTVFGFGLSYGTYLEMQSNNKTYKIINVNGIAATAKFSDLVLNTDYIEAGTVTSVSVATLNGVSGAVATATTTPVITLTLGEITPSAVQVSGLTASQITATDASKNLVSLAVDTYPSLSELTYVKDVTSAIQTQLNAKVTNPMTAGGDLIYGGAFGGEPLRLPNGLAGQVLRSNGTTVAPTWAAAGTVTTVTSANADATVNNTTTTPTITIVSAPKLTAGRTLSITGDLAYTSPSFDGSGNVTAIGNIANNAVTYAKIQNVSNNTVLGRIAGTAGVVEEISTTGSGNVVRAASPTFTGTVTAPIFIGALTGNAATTTALGTPRTINGVAFDGTANITVTAVAGAGTLTGTTLASNVVSSSLTSVGALTNLTVTNPIAGSITGNAATATNATTAGTVNAAAQPAITAVGTLIGLTVTAPIAGNVTGNAATVTTNANLIGPITSVGNTTSVASQTGTGTTFVMNTSPTLITPNLGTPATLVGTNINGIAAGLTAGNVTTNANLTGVVVSTGNSTTLGSFTSANLSGALTNETGSGVVVFGTSPTLNTPIINGTITGTTVVPIANGGTNSSTILNNNRIMVSNAGAIQEFAALTNGQLLIGSTNATPVAVNLTAGNGITITNAAGAITIANTPTIQQAIFTTAISTTSTTYAVATGLTITPDAGDYLVYFSSTSNNTSNNNVNNFSIFSNGVQVAASEVRHIATAGRAVPVHTNAYITGLEAGQAIDVRWNVSAGTGTLGAAATLIVQRVK